MTGNYPTKEQILAALPSTDIQKYVGILMKWKVDNYTNKWKQLSNKEKSISLFVLCYDLTNKPITVDFGQEYSYTPSQSKITLAISRPSILSTLHEIGHHELGYEELDACRFSVKLFQTVFPGEYSKLEWNGHMLRLPVNN